MAHLLDRLRANVRGAAIFLAIDALAVAIAAFLCFRAARRESFDADGFPKGGIPWRRTTC